MRSVFLALALLACCAKPAGDALRPAHAEAHRRCTGAAPEGGAERPVASHPADAPADGGGYVRELAPPAEIPCSPRADCTFIRSL